MPNVHVDRCTSHMTLSDLTEFIQFSRNCQFHPRHTPLHVKPYLYVNFLGSNEKHITTNSQIPTNVFIYKTFKI